MGISKKRKANAALGPTVELPTKHKRRMRIVKWLKWQGFTVAAEGIEKGEHLK